MDDGKLIDNRNYETKGSSLATEQVAVENIIETSKVQVVSTKMIKPIRNLFQRWVAGGRGGDDMSSTIEPMTARRE